MLDIDLIETKKEIMKRKAGTVLLQIPEGLKQHLTKIVEELQETGAVVFTSVDPCFGACDLALDKMSLLGADLLVHLGHAPIHRPKNVLHVSVYDKLAKKQIEKLAEKTAQALAEKNIKKIGLCTHSQFLYALTEMKKLLEKKGFEVFTAKGTPRIAFEGQVLGCNYTAATAVENEVDATVYFGEGYFHPFGLAISSKKPVFFADTSTQKVFELSKEREKYVRKRFAAIENAKKAESFGILVSTKTGQRYKQVALSCRQLIEENGKKAFIFTMDLVREDYMAGIKVDCFVNTACTRIVADDAGNWKKNIINPLELEIVFGKRKWEDFAFDVLY